MQPPPSKSSVVPLFSLFLKYSRETRPNVAVRSHIQTINELVRAAVENHSKGDRSFAWIDYVEIAVRYRLSMDF